MKRFYNINRSGKASPSSGGSAIPGIIPASPSAELLGTEALFVNCYGYACKAEDAIAALKRQDPVTFVTNVFPVTKVSESETLIKFDMGYPFIIDAISEPFMLDGVKTVTLRYRYPATRYLVGASIIIHTSNAHCFDESILHKKSAVFVPLGIDKLDDGKQLTWSASVPSDNDVTCQTGTIVSDDGGANKFTYLVLRTPIGSLTCDDAWIYRLEPRIEFDSPHLPPSMQSCFFSAPLSYPVAMSHTGTDLYFMCYRSDPYVDDPSVPSMLTFQFCKLGDLYNPIAELSDHYILSLGPDGY